MARFIHSVLAQNESVTAGTVETYDLPVNPLSHILLTVRFAQDSANTQLGFLDVLDVLDKIEILHRGSAVFSMSGLDCFACGMLIAGFESWGHNANGDDNEERSLTYCIPLTRTLYSPAEAFPRSTRGELVLQLTWEAAFTDLDDVDVQIETVELPDASPSQYLRMTTLTLTPSATGELDIDLPIGHKISDLVLFGTTFPADAATTATIQYIQLLADNQRIYYSQSNFETLHNMQGRLRPPPGYWGYHIHQIDGAAFAQYMDTSAVKADDHVLKQHLLVPFDIFRDGRYILETRGLSDLVLRIYAGDTNELRVIPCEIIEG